MPWVWIAFVARLFRGATPRGQLWTFRQWSRPHVASKQPIACAAGIYPKQKYPASMAKALEFLPAARAWFCCQDSVAGQASRPFNPGCKATGPRYEWPLTIARLPFPSPFFTAGNYLLSVDVRRRLSSSSRSDPQTRLPPTPCCASRSTRRNPAVAHLRKLPARRATSAASESRGATEAVQHVQAA